MTVKAAKLSNTFLYAGEAELNGKYVHVLAYQNKAESSGPNAMILPFPSNVKMDENNILDTRSYKEFLKNIAMATKEQTRDLSDDINLKSIRKRSAKVFDVGSYTVVLAEKAIHIKKAIEKVPEDKRPSISKEFLSDYTKLYPDQQVAICCWNGNINPEPLLWWYEPTNRENIFVPTMDAHDGNGPDLNAKVQRDHIISTGATTRSLIDKLPFKDYTSSTVDYTDNLPETAKQLLPTRVWGIKIDDFIKNGDMFIEPFSTINVNDRRIKMMGWE